MTMYQHIYFMPKLSGTYADTLAAFGLAVILREIYEQANGIGSGKRILLRDCGPYYQVELPQALKPEWVERCTFFWPPQTYAMPSKEKDEHAEVPIYDLDEGWQRFRQYSALRDQLEKNSAEGASLIRQQIEDQRPEPEFWIATFLGEDKMKAIKPYNRILEQWEKARTIWLPTLQALLRMSAQPVYSLEDALQVWQAPKKVDIKTELTACQLLNPTQGKGQNRPLPDGAKMGNVDSFWLLEFLKAVGVWHSMAPRLAKNSSSKKGMEDRKAYVISPLVISLGAHEAVFRRFCDRLWNDTAAKMDICAALLYTKELLEYSSAGQQDELTFEDIHPERVVAGFHVATYKALSSKAFTMLSLGFLGLPHWSGQLHSRQEVSELQQVIDEHLVVTKAIDEERSEGYRLLKLYRDFLSGGLLESFFEFMCSFSQYLTHCIEKRKSVKTFTIPNLRRLLMGMEPRLSDILDSEGFRNLAYAIRHSTILPQYHKAQGKTLYEVRYGLGMELKRKAAYSKEFLAALASFAHEYNQENVQKLESRGGKQLRKNIQTSDLEEIVRLVDQFGSELICNLLVAYGYAREPREETEAESKNEGEE